MFCEENGQEVNAEPPEWSYSMRQEKQLIVKGVYLGPYSAASKSQLSNLLDCGITHIVCVRHQMESRIIRPNFPDHFKYLIVEVADNPFENILIHFEQVIQFMQICIQNKGCVLVHGNAGMSRSAAFVVAFLMQQYEASFVDAYAHVKNKRFCVNLNLGFIHQLKEFEPIYKAKVGSDENSATCGGLKRNASEANFSINYMDT